MYTTASSMGMQISFLTGMELFTTSMSVLHVPKVILTLSSQDAASDTGAVIGATNYSRIFYYSLVSLSRRPAPSIIEIRGDIE